PLGAADNMQNLSLLTCADEDAVFDALENGVAAFGLLPEDALFSRYPATDYNIVYKISQYSGQMGVCTMKQEYAPLVLILDRYLTQTQEGDMLREAIRARQQSIRQEKIFAGEKKVLTRLAAKGGDFRYAQAGLDEVPFFWHNGDGAHGELVDFLAFVEDVTGFSFQESSYVGAQAVQALDDGEILFVSGMPFIGGGQAYCFAATGMDWLVPVVPAADKEVFCVGEEEVRTALTQRYWGVVQDFLPLLSGTEFDGHTVGFSDGKALYEAMQRGEISGMLIGQESYDALLLSGEIGYVMLTDPVLLEIRFPFACGLAFVKENREEAECFGRLWEFYRLLHTEDESAPGWYRAEFEKVKREVSGLTRAVWGLGAAVVLFSAAFVLSRRSAKRKRRG
ncbi:MAG: hypothetical protein K2N63_04530, partial [Lachnospiraceae bacterium]|nr:hypothetical protein [Lachnospiraceae bacterium]